MSIIDMIREDVGKITSDLSNFALPATIYYGEGEIAKDISVIHTHHRFNVDTDGNPINQMNAHVSISFKELEDKEIPYKSGSGHVNLRNTPIYVDGKWFRISECWPSETMQLLSCILVATEPLVTGVFDDTFDNTFA